MISRASTPFTRSRIEAKVVKDVMRQPRNGIRASRRITPSPCKYASGGRADQPAVARIARSIALCGFCAASASSSVRPRQRGSVASMIWPELSVTSTAAEIPAQARSNFCRSTSTAITPSTSPPGAILREYQNAYPPASRWEEEKTVSFARRASTK